METALAQVINLAAKSSGVTGAVLLSSFEHLADVATREHNDDAEFYRAVVKECRQFESKDNLRLLVTHLVGIPTAKRMAASVDTWRKGNKSDNVKVKDMGLSSNAVIPQATGGHNMPPPVMNYGWGAPNPFYNACRNGGRGGRGSSNR